VVLKHIFTAPPEVPNLTHLPDAVDNVMLIDESDEIEVYQSRVVG
jgi:hypothetical protein